MAGQVVVTGVKELDAKLRAMEAKLQRKLIRGALKRGGNRLKRDALQIIKAEAFDTGALYKATQVKPLKAKKTRVGVSVLPPRDRLFSAYAKQQQRARKKAGNATFEKPKTDYYPAFAEFGTEKMPAVKPFRRALYENAEAYKAYFVGDLNQFIAEQKVTTKL